MDGLIGESWVLVLELEGTAEEWDACIAAGTCTVWYIGERSPIANLSCTALF